MIGRKNKRVKKLSLEEIREQQDLLSNFQKSLLEEENVIYNRLNSKIIATLTFILGVGGVLEIAKTFFDRKLNIFFFLMFGIVFLSLIFLWFYTGYTKKKNDIFKKFEDNQKYLVFLADEEFRLKYQNRSKSDN